MESENRGLDLERELTCSVSWPQKASLRRRTGELDGPRDKGHMLATNALLRNMTALVDMLVLVSYANVVTVT